MRKIIREIGVIMTVLGIGIVICKSVIKIVDYVIKCPPEKLPSLGLIGGLMIPLGLIIFIMSDKN